MPSQLSSPCSFTWLFPNSLGRLETLVCKQERPAGFTSLAYTKLLVQSICSSPLPRAGILCSMHLRVTLGNSQEEEGRMLES